MFGTYWRKLVRKDAPPTSQESAKTIDSSSLERLVYETIGLFPDGCIQDEVLKTLAWLPYSSVTARFSALIDKGLVVDTGLTRPGRSGRQQRVLKLKKANDA